MVIGGDTYIDILNLTKFKKCDVDYSGDFLMLNGMVNLNDKEVIIAITEFSNRFQLFLFIRFIHYGNEFTYEKCS